MVVAEAGEEPEESGVKKPREGTGSSPLTPPPSAGRSPTQAGRAAPRGPDGCAASPEGRMKAAVRFLALFAALGVGMFLIGHARAGPGDVLPISP